MKKIFFLLLTNGLLNTAFCQTDSYPVNYWQQQVNYTIDVSLNDTNNSLTGFENIEYINHSPDTLKYIWFHLWPNAYKNDKTAFSDQLLENGNTKFYFSGKDEKGYINRLDFKVNNITATVEDHPEHIDIVKIILPDPLPPNQKINITTPFYVKFPITFPGVGMRDRATRPLNGIPSRPYMTAKAGTRCPTLTRENSTVSLEALKSISPFLKIML
ncbi:MAG: hypothetical protein IPQ06_03685 [Chitinophagaceae bacterium]|nr:hypothetical protein [Chitinophagaceae bacterium]